MKAEGEGAQSQSKEAEDDKLLEEYYLKFKGPSDDKKYHLIPKFYSKVCTEWVLMYRLQLGARFDSFAH